MPLIEPLTHIKIAKLKFKREMREVKAILTVKNNKNNKCVIEILNRLYIRDMKAEAQEIVKNVILVYSSLSPVEVYGLLISAPPSCLAKIFPVIYIINSVKEEKIITDTVNFIKSLKDKFSTFYVECYDRGIRVNCREIEIGIGLGLKDIMKVNFEKPDKVIVVNVIKDTTYVSVINKGQEKVSVTPLS